MPVVQTGPAVGCWAGSEVPKVARRGFSARQSASGDRTERPVTVTLGTNYLFGDLNPEKVYGQFLELLSGKGKTGKIRVV